MAGFDLTTAVAGLTDIVKSDAVTTGIIAVAGVLVSIQVVLLAVHHVRRIIGNK